MGKTESTIRGRELSRKYWLPQYTQQKLTDFGVKIWESKANSDLYWLRGYFRSPPHWTLKYSKHVASDVKRGCANTPFSGADKLWLSTPIGYKDFTANNPFAERLLKVKGKCKYCSSDKVVKDGFKNDKQQYKCKECGHKFINPKNHAKMTVPREVIATSLELYYDGLSLRKVTRHIQKIYKVTVTYKTIRNWIEKYTPLVKDFVNTLTPTIGNIWHIDETVVKVNGDIWWYWEVMDRNSRLILGTHLSRTRTIMDAEAVFSRALTMSKDKPHTVICDGWHGYHKGLKKAIGGQYVHRHVNFIQRAGVGKHYPNNNNRIERFHNTLKDRTKNMRGLKNPQQLLDGFCLHYNLIRPHQTLTVTPARYSAILLPFEDGWGDMIDWATYYKTLSNSN